MKRIAAFILAFIVLCQVFAGGAPASVLATDSLEPQQLCEVVELREKNSETYRMSDGTYECAIFSYDKYYEDGSGKLVEINNSIVSSKHLYRGIEYGFTNEANSTRAYFAVNGPKILVSTDARSISFGVDVDRDIKPLIGGMKDPEVIAGYSLSGDNCILYSDAYEHTDLVYEVGNGLVKEYIILKDEHAPTEFTFVFDSENYAVKHTNYGRVGFYNIKGELDFELGGLFAVDSSGIVTEKLSYTICEASDNKTEITVTLSERYAKSPERVYPILIDPSIMVTGEYNTQDSYVSSKYPSTNYYMNNYIRMGRDNNYYVRRTFIRFNLPSSVQGESITSAYINLKKNSCGNSPSLKALRVTGSWTSSTICWNNMPGYTTSYQSSYAVPTSNNWYRIYVTDIVKRWNNGTYQNYGFMIKNNSESGTDDWSTFFSSDAASPNKPELRITYGCSGTAYYMAFPEDGKMITSNPNGILSKDSFISGDDYQHWVFSPVGNDIYIIRMKNNLNECLTAVPGTLKVIVDNYIEGNTNQYWSIYTSSNNNAIYSRSSNPILSGKRIYYNGSSFMLCDGVCSSINLIKVDSFVPCTSIYIPTISINIYESTAIFPEYSPTGASATSNVWTTYTAHKSQSNTTIFTVDSDGVVYAENIGCAILTVKNKITNVSYSVEVRVSKQPHPDAQNKEKWCWVAASKMVGEHNSASVNLETGASLLVNTAGVKTFFCGCTYDYHYTADAGQRYIVYTICGSDGNIAAEEPYYVSQALIYASGGMTTNHLGNGTMSITDMNSMRNNLQNGKWVVVIIQNDFQGTAHAVVFKSFNMDIYTIWDPDDNMDYQIILTESNTFELNDMYYRISDAFLCY